MANRIDRAMQVASQAAAFHVATAFVGQKVSTSLVGRPWFARPVVRAACTHADASFVWIHLPGQAWCADCLYGLMRGDSVSARSNACDGCEAPTVTFYPLLATGYEYTYVGELCAACLGRAKAADA